ncbi:MAG: hypothetical protein QG573_1438 [Acidobacteriota bacterium]|nr:hypothetical protein [Acidobacteriota bacterium]
MKGFVLDTSVAIAVYLPEVFSPSARSYWERIAATGARCVVPSLHLWEFGNVLRTRVRNGALGEASALEIYGLHLDAPLEIVEPDPQEILEVAFEFGVTTYDAVYISLALGSDLTLLTAESVRKPWVAKLGDRVVAIS